MDTVQPVSNLPRKSWVPGPLGSCQCSSMYHFWRSCTLTISNNSNFHTKVKRLPFSPSQIICQPSTYIASSLILLHFLMKSVLSACAGKEGLRNQSWESINQTILPHCSLPSISFHASSRIEDIFLKKSSLEKQSTPTKRHPGFT